LKHLDCGKIAGEMPASQMLPLVKLVQAISRRSCRQ